MAHTGTDEFGHGRSANYSTCRQDSFLTRKNKEMNAKQKKKNKKKHKLFITFWGILWIG
jgi:hypothetical protein